MESKNHNRNKPFFLLKFIFPKSISETSRKIFVDYFFFFAFPCAFSSQTENFNAKCLRYFFPANFLTVKTN